MDVPLERDDVSWDGLMKALFGQTMRWQWNKADGPLVRDGVKQ
jgi:hypothetical protein